MPELPEVETIANGVHARIHGRRILSVWTSGKPQTFKSPESEIAAALTGATIQSVRRVGKTIVMTTTPRITTTPGGPSFPASSERVGSAVPQPSTKNPASAPTELLIHLGMTGRLLVSAPDVPLPPHTHAILTLSPASGESAPRELRFVDPRRFGRLSIHSPAPNQQPTTSNQQPPSYAGPGREPLTIPLPDFVALFRNRRTPIKAALLNQSLLHGVGNIYADEALFRAHIRPTRQAASLTRAEFTLLRRALIDILRHAISLGGSSVSDYVDADGVRGFFQLRHKVYQRTGQPCLVCRTPIKKITLAGRSTHFCPYCQK
jgi:formamidopyrimidine-DNA glycosylase